MLKNIYNKFSDQFVKSGVSDEDTKEFKGIVNRMINDELSGLTRVAIRE